MAEATPEATRQQIEADTTQLFLPYRGFCARKGVCVSVSPDMIIIFIYCLMLVCENEKEMS